MLDFLSGYYSNYKSKFSNNLLTIISSMMCVSTCNTSSIARDLQKKRGHSFKASDMFLYRFLGNPGFQIDDKLWRCHINTIFAHLQQKKNLQKGDRIYINVDFTSDSQDFLILCASIQYDGHALPIYFTMRRYPKEAGTYDHKKMEEAFLKGLKHCLSKHYKYVIIADRGFGNQRFIELCEALDLEYAIRMQPNPKVIKKEDGKEVTDIMDKVATKDGKHTVTIVRWKRDISLYRYSEGDKTWYITSNIKDNTGAQVKKIYEQRFKIEKNFQDLKSSGFDIEKSKIRKYDRFKRMFFMGCMAYSLMVITGKFIEKHRRGLKKN